MITEHHYSVGDASYCNKIEALHAASKTGKQVIWHWHSEFSHMPWQDDPSWSLREIYRARAQQLRDQYDYLVLSFSGGSDSWTVLDSFISNGIHLDEVFFRWPFSATRNSYQVNNHDTNPINHLSEWDFTVSPALDKLYKTNPEIKITLHDLSDKILSTQHNDNHILQTGDNLSAGWWAKNNAMGNNERRMIDSGKKTAFIMGLDKPQICVQENKVFCYFLDLLINNSNVIRANDGRTREFFYWSPSMPQVVHTQARAIYNHIKNRPDICALINWKREFSSERKHIWDKVARSIIYPDYDLNQFQSRKDNTVIDIQTESWLNLVAESRFFDRWKSLINNVLGSIDDRFICYRDGKPCGFNGFTSQFYYLGDINQPDS